MNDTKMDVSFRSKTRLVEEYLRRKIARGEIRPGQKLRQDDVARKLGVSSTPVRKALRRLETEGLVTHAPHRGVAVRDLDPSYVREVYDLKALLEGYSTRKAVPSLSDEDIQTLVSLQKDMRRNRAAGKIQRLTIYNDKWHMTIHSASGSDLLRQSIIRLWRMSPWDALLVVPGRADAALDEHERILAAVKEHNARDAEQAMVDHIRNAEIMLLDFLSSKKGN